MKRSIRLPCADCNGKGDKPDDRGIVVVCDACLGMRFHDVNPDGPCCDIATHDEVPAET